MNCSMVGRRMLLYMLCALSGVCLLHGQLGATLAGSFVVKALNLFAVRGSKQMFPGTAHPLPSFSSFTHLGHCVTLQGGAEPEGCKATAADAARDGGAVAAADRGLHGI